MAIKYEVFQDGGLKYLLLKLSAKLTNLLAEKVGVNDVATDSTLGLVKTNANKLASPNETKWKLQVANDGTLTTEAIS